VPLIEDDVYGDLYFGGRRARAMKAFGTQGLVLLCSSLSKTIDPQLRVGWILVGRYLEEILYRKFVNMFSTLFQNKLCAEVDIRKRKRDPQAGTVGIRTGRSCGK
jgi:DNA-binding transcriptional MocR family regulator